MVTFFIVGVNTCANGGNVADVVAKISAGADIDTVIGIVVAVDVKIGGYGISIDGGCGDVTMVSGGGCVLSSTIPFSYSS